MSSSSAVARFLNLQVPSAKDLHLSSVNQDERSASIKMRIPARAGGWRA